MGKQPPEYDWNMMVKTFLCLTCFRPMKVARESTMDRHLRFCSKCRNLVEIRQDGGMFEYHRP